MVSNVGPHLIRTQREREREGWKVNFIERVPVPVLRTIVLISHKSERHISWSEHNVLCSERTEQFITRSEWRSKCRSYNWFTSECWLQFHLNFWTFFFVVVQYSTRIVSLLSYQLNDFRLSLFNAVYLKRRQSLSVI